MSMSPGPDLAAGLRALPAVLLLTLAAVGGTAGCSSKSLTADPSACAGLPVPTIACAVGPTVQTCALDANGRPTWVTSCPGESTAGTTGSGGAAGGTGGAGGADGGGTSDGGGTRGVLGDSCPSDETCQRGLVCTVSDGVCNAPPGCSPNTPCPAVCYGTCRAASSPSCTADKDCRLEADYCTGCDCRILGPGDSLPACPGPGVSCFIDPCTNVSVHCRAGVCVSP
jgi:hypothetical protein